MFYFIFVFYYITHCEFKCSVPFFLFFKCYLFLTHISKKLTYKHDYPDKITKQYPEKEEKPESKTHIYSLMCFQTHYMKIHHQSSLEHTVDYGLKHNNYVLWFPT